jgi:hypothetical protein
MLAAVLPHALVTALIYGGVFCAVLTIIILVSKKEQRNFAKPFREKAERIGKVKCQRCGHEGFLTVKVKTQSNFTPNTPVPQAVDGALLCEKCASPEWTSLNGDKG